MTDGALIARAKAGEMSAFGLLVRTHQGRVRAFLMRLTKGDHALADDLAQECFLDAYRKLKQFRGEGSFAGWLHRIAYSRFLMHLRRHDRRSDGAEMEMADDGASGEAAHMARLDLEQAMARLSAPESAALTLCYALGYSNEEAAQILNVPLGTLKSHVLRGREKLKVLLGAWDSEAKT